MKHFSAEEYRNRLWPEGKPRCRGCKKQNLAHVIVDYSGELREEYECMDCGTVTSANFSESEDRRPRKRMRIRSRFSKDNKNGRSKANGGGKSNKGKRN